MLRAVHGMWRRVLLVLLVVLGGTGVALTSGSSSAVAAECPMPPGYVQVIQDNGVVYETVYCPPGWEDWGYEPDPGSGDTGGGEVRVCTFAGEEIPCSTAAGVWDGSCYVKPLSPQPPKEDPRWEGHEDGVIVSCVNVSDATGGACSEGGACTYTYKWIAAMPGAGPSPETVARQAVASMGLGMGQIGVTGGDPEGTGWRTVVGLPIWLWVADPGPSTTGPNTATASVSTVSVTATATLERIDWTMTTPQGVVTTTCSGPNASGTVYAASYGAQPSPTCGFQAAEVQIRGEVTITGTAHWSVEWAGAGHVGSFDMEPMSQSAQLEVIEVQSIRTGGG